MEIKWILFLMRFMGIIIIGILLNESIVAHANSNQSEGSIGFYGKYESEIEPQPNPPSGLEILPPSLTEVKNKQLFPQMGHIIKQQWIWIGCTLISLVLLDRIKRKKEDSSKTTLYLN